jgi:two-component system response regulator WspF
MELKQASILLVDDEPFLREIMGEWLARVAGQVFCAEDGAEALKILAANKIDLILSDVRMPVMDGVETTRRIMASTPCAILIVTGPNSPNAGALSF